MKFVISSMLLGLVVLLAQPVLEAGTLAQTPQVVLEMAAADGLSTRHQTRHHRA